jgi:dynein heavy chain
VTQIVEALPENIDFLKVLSRASKLHHDKSGFKSDPLIACLLQEIKTYNALLDKIREDLEFLRKAVIGQDVLSQELEDLLLDLSQYKVPPTWKPYISCKSLFSWLEDLNVRVDHMRDWGLKGGLITFSLGCFIYPNGFLTAVLQTHSRKTGVSIDTLKFDFTFSSLKENEQVKPKEGVLIKGLYLQGGKWNTTTNRLVDADPMTLTYQLPIVHFKPVKKSFKSSLKVKFFDCPCYYAPLRQDVGLTKCYLFNILLPIGHSDRDFIYDSTLFVKRGTSLVLSLDD